MDQAAKPLDLSDETRIIDFTRSVKLDYKNNHLYLNDEDVDSFLTWRRGGSYRSKSFGDC